MAYHIPFNEHLTITADTAAEVRQLIAEFGVSISPAPQLPRAAPDVVMAPTVSPRQIPAAAARDAGDELGAQLLTLLGQDGPQNTKALAKAIGVDAATARRYLQGFAAKGLVHSEGTTVSQRWHLGAKGAGPRRGSAKAAKEAP